MRPVIVYFQGYCDETECHSNSASAALNKWLKQVAGPNYVIHSFRHSMRDRLRAVLIVRQI